ncbi:hypothetical protein JFK97_10865 [Chromobacterium phragmitis]|uniref:hypothetical protein n=1 Tax=Chromobacterium amazonense TaxID=1382803 RepID=UPI0021B826A5|nr:hypothetical protein [Chromobacterium amazonense]MBM2884888.1 hypothetical protein [Chromobacterium amazonense]MDE1714766.1 hypothetical protein [Chromobacterium amazonense]
MSAISSRASTDAEILARLRRFPSIAPLIDAALQQCTRDKPLTDAMVRLSEARMVLSLALGTDELSDATPACSALFVVERLLEQVEDLLTGVSEMGAA